MEQIDKIKAALTGKAALKQDVFATTLEVFTELKEELSQISKELIEFIEPKDDRIFVDMKSPSKYECQISAAGDTMVFHMHTNVFAFPEEHPFHKSPYISEHPENGYCGIINIYNFLTDSFRFNRQNDSGYLVGRIFVNRERHFFVEGRGQLGFLFRDFPSSEFTRDKMREVSEVALLYAIDFDLYTPPYRAVQEVNLGEIKSLSQDLKLKTAKRLGFQFSSTTDPTA
ncbi:MAG: hypothetical protein Salg2KO_15090 [Salibacteraceae bacterium]